MKGKLIVFEGTDGSGKATQVKLLSDHLGKQKILHEVISFPRYGQNPYADLVRSYLDGKFGPLEKVDPHLISLAFAGDRFLAKPKIEKWLDEGKFVIADRYISSNKAHMGANLPLRDREEFMEWLDTLEYETNQLPREDFVIFLYVSPDISRKYMSKREKDILEKDLAHQKKSLEIYMEFAKGKQWITIYCVEDGKLRSKDDIHKEIVDKLNLRS